MSLAADIIAALALPAEARQDKRIPKKLLLERGAPTAADKRKLSEGLDTLRLHAQLGPSNLNIAAHRGPTHAYEEIAVLRATFRPEAKLGRLVELIHRAIPYPVVLVAEQAERSLLALAPKRRSEAEADRFVLDDRVESTGLIDPASPPVGWAEFLASLPVVRQPASDLRACYLGWAERILALQAAAVTGLYRPRAGQGLAVRETLDTRDGVLSSLTRLRAAARKETRIPKQVELNLEIKRLELTLQHLEAAL
jgi:hypothetical protein